MSMVWLGNKCVVYVNGVVIIRVLSCEWTLSIAAVLLMGKHELWWLANSGLTWIWLGGNFDFCARLKEKKV
jgi:hypothetical protein